MEKRYGASNSGPRTRGKAAEERREAREAQGLDKLPPEVWDKILDKLDENDLFPLALSCRYFREKQKELMARKRQRGPESGKSRLALKTTLYGKSRKGQPASADYLRFCSKEKVSKDAGQKKALYIRCLAAFHGHLPLLQELLKSLNTLDKLITVGAGEFSSSQTLLLLVLASDLFLAFSSSKHAEANWRPCSG